MKIGGLLMSQPLIVRIFLNVEPTLRRRRKPLPFGEILNIDASQSIQSNDLISVTVEPFGIPPALSSEKTLVRHTPNVEQGCSEASQDSLSVLRIDKGCTWKKNSVSRYSETPSPAWSGYPMIVLATGRGSKFHPFLLALSGPARTAHRDF